MRPVAVSALLALVLSPIAIGQQEQEAPKSDSEVVWEAAIRGVSG